MPLLKSVQFEVCGKVQGVFFRKYTKKTADKYGLSGWVLNTTHGTVQGNMEGPQAAVSEMKKWLQSTGSPQSRIDKCNFYNEKDIAAKTCSSFTVIRDKQEVTKRTFKV